MIVKILVIILLII